MELDPTNETVTVYAGTANYSHHGDGPASSASFGQPVALSVDNVGNLFVVEAVREG